MTEHNTCDDTYASFTTAQLSLLKVATLSFDKLVILDPIGASWASIRKAMIDERPHVCD